MGTKRSWKDKELLRFEEVMEVIDVTSKQTIYNLLGDGKLIAHHPSGKAGTKGIRVLTSSVKEYLDKGVIPSKDWNK